MIRIPISLAFTSWIVFAALSSSAAQAACSRWDVSGAWQFVQTNGFSPRFTLQQAETGIQGEASYVAGGEDPSGFIQHGNDAYVVSGSVDGMIDGNSFEVKAYWDNGTTGVYTGTIGPQGRIEGSTYDAQHPQSMAIWHSDRTAKCLAKAGGTSAAGVSPSSITPPVVGNNDAICTEYAATAVKQNDENVAMHCGFTGARWDSNATNHENWCRVVAPDLSVSETAARTDWLKDCREQIARRGEIVQKPNIPIGDLTQPVTPPPSEPLPPGGTGNFLKQMKP